MINAGKLDRIIRILALTLPAAPTYSAAVQVDINTNTNWNVIAAGVPAWVRDVGGREAAADNKIQSERTAIFTIRYNSAVKESHYVEFESKIWRIIAIEEIGRREGHAITATKISS